MNSINGGNDSNGKATESISGRSLQAQTTIQENQENIGDMTDTTIAACKYIYKYLAITSKTNANPIEAKPSGTANAKKASKKVT